MTTVSVVIPCFNVGQHLVEAVESGLAQTYKSLEVVIVDDGSTDPETLSLLERARWPRTRIFHQANAGPSAARNRAIRETLGEYILPLDADDTIEPTYVEKAVAVLDNRPEVGCVYCKAMKFGAEEGPWNLPPYRLEELAVDNVIFVTALFRKDDWQKIGGFDENLRHGVEDYDFWVKMVASGKDVVQLDEYLFNYRVQEKSRTTRFQDGLVGKVATYAGIFRNSSDFYARHAEIIFQHRFSLYAQIADWQQRYGDLKATAEARDRELLARCNELESALAEFRTYWQGRYGELDEFVNRHPWWRKGAGGIKRILRSPRNKSFQSAREEHK